MSPINLMFRILLAFILVWGVLRILGKKEMGKITYQNMATAAALGTLAGGLISDSQTNPIYYIAGLIGFPFLTFLMGYISLKSEKARTFFEGKPTMVISKGEIIEENLGNMRLSSDNLLEKLREKKVFSLSDVEYGIMEPDGKMSILLKNEKQPVTQKDMGFSTAHTNLPISVIKDGNVLHSKLKELGITKNWLMEQLKIQNITTTEDVFLAQIDSSGKLYVDRK